MTIEEVKKTVEGKMDQSINAFKGNLTKIRTGRANPALLDSVQVDYYGSLLPISQVANMSLLDSRTISIQPWEKGMGAKIEKAIRDSDLVFAWITSQDCYGTLVELGYAAALGCKIAVAVPKYLDDLWFATETAGYVVCGEPSPAKALTEAIAWARGSKVEAL